MEVVYLVLFVWVFDFDIYSEKGLFSLSVYKNNI